MQSEPDADPQPAGEETPPSGARHAAVGMRDAGVSDAGVSDAGVSDAGVSDAGVSDPPVVPDAVPASAAPPTMPPVAPTPALPATSGDQATMLDLRREQLANGANAPPAASPAPPLSPQAGAELGAHDAATYQDAPPGVLPAWRSPSAPPYVPTHAPRPPLGTMPSPRSHTPWRTAQSWGPTTFTISADTAAGFSYLLWWLTGLIVYFAERNNRYVRFHALQSILLTSVFTVLGVVVYVLDALLGDLTRVTHWTFFGALGSGLAVVVVMLGIVVPWLGTMIGAWTGHYIRWPIVGAYAERYAASPLQIPGSPI